MEAETSNEERRKSERGGREVVASSYSSRENAYVTECAAIS
jgi:uncharacterized protein YkuJ